ncbi:MAG: sulfotransferase, partial [bacterium]|nr:sulfotransferase [bacterium]
KDLDGKILVDFIGKYDNLQADYEEACCRIGIKPPPLPHKRQAKDREDYRNYYDADLAELVSNYFQKDIQTFAYTF